MADTEAQADEVHDPRPRTSTHIGRAGEHFVAGHLLRLGYNAATLPVDTGVDLLSHWTTAFSESRVALVQVKTTERRRMTFRLSRRQLDRLWEDHINIVCVFWYDATAPFALVLPPSLIYMLTSGGRRDPKAPILAREDGASVIVGSSASGVAYIRNRAHDLSRMINRFDRIEATDGDPYVMPDYAVWADVDSGALVQIDPDPRNVDLR